MPNIFPVDTLPRFTTIDPATIEPQLKQWLDLNRSKLKQILAEATSPTWDNLMLPLEEMNDVLNKAWAPISHLHSVLETDALRQAYNAVVPLLSEYHTEISQNETLYQAIASLAKSEAFNQLNNVQKKIIENDLRDFKLSGIHLPTEDKKRLAELQKSLTQLTTLFSQNILDATGDYYLHVTDEKKMAGLPPQALKLAVDAAEARGLSGYVFTLEYPSYSTALKFLKDREIRKTLYEAYVTRASDRGPAANKFDNSKVMESILANRHEMAKILGFQNFAEYSLATKMANDPQQILDFLYDLLKRSRKLAETEYQAIKDLAKATDGIDPLESWDTSYYSEKLREATFNFSQEDLRPYFPINQVLAGMYDLVKKLYGLTIVKVSDVDIWHPHVEFFAIYDETKALRGGFYIDLYARSHKRDGAWMDDCLNRKKNAKGLQYPVAFLTCNFMPPMDDKPALLNHDEVLTLFHEFGHCLHHMLTKVDYPSVAGINGVAWDAVEFPSQFMENFCLEKEPLNTIARHYQTGEKLPDALYQKILAAKYFQTGLQMVRQLEFALFDFLLHLNFDPTLPNQIQIILDAVRKEAAVLSIPEFNRFQHSFSHIFAGGYAAGYYSYKWAEVLSADAYAQFEERGLFDRESGRSFMENILEVGGTREPMASFIAFRGRKPTIDALLRHSGIK
ncbi:MAG: M3 family metallopeptidase [Gammaproteobacteria bacterium]|nr:M3 family metallopeptidase [Gammaproteobacteria bacterium]